jgi:hypothetical protein
MVKVGLEFPTLSVCACSLLTNGTLEKMQWIRLTVLLLLGTACRTVWTTAGSTTRLFRTIPLPCGASSDSAQSWNRPRWNSQTNMDIPSRSKRVVPTTPMPDSLPVDTMEANAVQSVETCREAEPEIRTRRQASAERLRLLLGLEPPHHHPMDELVRNEESSLHTASNFGSPTQRGNNNDDDDDENDANWWDGSLRDEHAMRRLRLGGEWGEQETRDTYTLGFQAPQGHGPFDTFCSND